MSSCPQDKHFGPGSTCRALDFTLYFEETILSLAPDVIFAVVALLRLAYLRSQIRCVGSSAPTYAFLALKLAAVLLLTAATVGSVVASRHSQVFSASLRLAAPIIQVLDMVPLILLVVAEHFRTLTPSTLVITYAFIKGLFTAASMRSSIDLDDPTRTTALLALATAAYFAVSAIEIIGKPRSIMDTDIPRMSTSSFVMRSFYLWLFPLLWTGRKKTLTIADCGSIPREMGSRASTTPLLDVLVSTTDKKNYLVRASLKAFPMLFISPIPPRILLVVAAYMQPLLALRMIAFVADPAQSSVRGWSLVGGFILTYALIFLLTSVYWEKVFNCAVNYRAALVGNIYDKTLRLSSASGREVGGGVASTYMSVDVERVCQGLETLHEFWAAILSVALTVIVLYSQVTWPAFFPLLITFFMIFAAGWVSKGVGAAHKAWLGATDKRVKFLTSIINNYLPMKLSQYEEVFARRAADLRRQEMKGARSFYYNITITGTMSTTAWAACTLAVLGPYAALVAHGRGIGPLDPQRIFTIVSAVNLMSPPLTILSSSMPQLKAAYASLKRIEKYLLLEERQDLPARRDNAAPARETEKQDRWPSNDITLQSASFSWAPDKSAFLGPLSLSLTPGHLHLVAGPVASGKTLFLLSLLGESVCTTGTFVPPDTTIAYAAQDPLIVSGTIRDNILFGQEFSEGWYERVLRACALTGDIEGMDAKDGTFIGEKGATLSGGQRQRVSLARAIYAKAPWTLLDDTFSSLDAETETHVFEALFGFNGLLKDKGVVLVTHNAKHLNHADHVLILKAGTAQYDGTLSEIIAAGYQFARKAESNVGVAATDEGGTKAVVVDTKAKKAHVAEKERAEAPLPASSLGSVPYFFWLNMAGWGGALLSGGLFILTGLVRLGLQIYLQEWSSSDGTRLGVWVAGYSALTVGTMVTIALGMVAYTLLITGNIGENIHAQELRGLLHTSPAYFMRTPAGRIVNRFSQDIFQIDLDFANSMFNFVYSSVLLAGTVVFILIPTPWLTLVVPFLGAFYWLILSFYLKTSKQFQQLSAASKSPLYTLFSTTLSGLATIRALRVEGYFRAQIDGHLNQSQIPFYFRFAGIRFLRSFLALISFVLAAGLSVLAVGLRHTTNPSSLGLALASLTSITGQLTGILMNISNLENGSVALSRIHEIASLPEEEEEDSTGEKGNRSSEKDSSVPFAAYGAVEFRDVRLQYEEAKKPAVNGVSFTVGAGQKIGICGRTGSGKSSLIMALFRAVEISGDVLIDGVSTKAVRLPELRNAMSLVSQSPFIWNAPLRHNLDPHGESTDKDIWLALEKVGLHSAISELPKKLETLLDEGGSFSAGQRQLLCLARVLLRSRQIVVLDEASSSLDVETERKIQDIVRTDLTGATVFSVAHRIETIVDFDLIIVMEDGVIAETGTPKSLLSRPESRFTKLAASQGISGAA
ncbi:P-loop containing nucleoside triphosphate hydrolase protein [Mycena alexandri]|uniref:P-loop containing nucleoside triphosphate hydrolase protein n=1 Tax=Mycena alexandri TaxID=1745969 RepID=A0AAD6WYG4_9AGAR|nr:P-loop containing nucleoside triphosphate hydrolase protein [Mycena alexandri]